MIIRKHEYKRTRIVDSEWHEFICIHCDSRIWSTVVDCVLGKEYAKCPNRNAPQTEVQDKQLWVDCRYKGNDDDNTEA
jgi:hypothetical protein